MNEAQTKLLMENFTSLSVRIDDIVSDLEAVSHPTHRLVLAMLAAMPEDQQAKAIAWLESAKQETPQESPQNRTTLMFDASALGFAQAICLPSGAEANAADKHGDLHEGNHGTQECGA